MSNLPGFVAVTTYEPRPAPALDDLAARLERLIAEPPAPEAP